MFFQKKKKTLVLGWNVAQLTEYLSAPGFIPKQCIKWACWYRPLIPVLRKWRPESQRLKVILDEFWTSLGYIRAYKTMNKEEEEEGKRKKKGRKGKQLALTINIIRILMRDSASQVPSVGTSLPPSGDMTHCAPDHPIFCFWS